MPDPRERPRRDLWREASGRRREQRQQHPSAPSRPRAQRPAHRPTPRDARKELRESLLPGLSDLIDPTNRRADQTGASEYAGRSGPHAGASDQLTQPLTDDERRSFVRRYRAQPPAPESDDPGDDFPGGYPISDGDRGNHGPERMSGRTVTLGAILVIGILAVSLGAGGVFDNRGAGAPEPTATVPPVVVALGSPTASAAIAAADGESTTANPLVDDPEWPGQGDGRTVVCIDPGHGGWDQGFSRPLSGFLPGLAEEDYNLAHAYDLGERLEEDGFEVVMTRRTPSAVNAEGLDVNGDGETIADSEAAGTIDELQARINICNEAQADLLVSMHINGSEARPLVKGYETWYTGSRPFSDYSQRFATLVFRALGTEMEGSGYITDPREVNDDRTISVDESNSNLLDNMIMTGPDVRGVINASEMPGAIVEALFISNGDDARFLDSPEGHDAIVSAYERAIIDYFDETQS